LPQPGAPPVCIYAPVAIDYLNAHVDEEDEF